MQNSNPDKLVRLEDVVTPPYDIIDEKTQAAFQARNPHNMIFLDISKSPGKGDESDERYNSARDYFIQWQEEEILIRDEEPAIYLYYIDYNLPSGIRLTRCRARFPTGPPGDGSQGAVPGSSSRWSSSRHRPGRRLSAARNPATALAPQCPAGSGYPCSPGSPPLVSNTAS